jgi:micrococcal nuclease
VVDGDTLVATLDSEPGEWTVRLLGIDTPETKDPRKPVECFGKEASQKLTELLSNQRINLQADPEADEIDKYSRLLRNVFLADGTDVNALMVSEGYAYVYLSFPLNTQRKTELRNLQKDAQENLRGLWGSCH